jgi:hypothetical protein
MRVLSLLCCCVALVVFAAASLALAAADTDSIPNAHLLGKRLHLSQELTLESIKKLEVPSIREHLMWRGDACEECDNNDRDKMLQILHDHVMAGTPCSVKAYSDASAKSRNFRQSFGLGDNVMGNNPNRRQRSREKRANPNDPLGSLKDVLSAHGLEMRTMSTGQKDAHEFMEKAKKRKEGVPRPDRDFDL